MQNNTNTNFIETLIANFNDLNKSAKLIIFILIVCYIFPKNTKNTYFCTKFKQILPEFHIINN